MDLPRFKIQTLMILIAVASLILALALSVRRSGSDDERVFGDPPPDSVGQ
jgi:hypothetical protein